jgi:hypothetical protein
MKTYKIERKPNKVIIQPSKTGKNLTGLALVEILKLKGLSIAYATRVK